MAGKKKMTADKWVKNYFTDIGRHNLYKFRSGMSMHKTALDAAKEAGVEDLQKASKMIDKIVAAFG